MFPILFHLGPLTIRTYGFMVALAFLAALQVARFAARARKIGELFLLDLVALLIIAGLIGARLFYILINLSYFREHPAESFKVWEGGLVFYGGFILAAFVGVIFTKYRGYDVSEVADCLSPALALGQSIGRWGCFFAGCCYGRPTSHFWGISFQNPASLAPLHVSLHPVQLLESIGSLGIAGLTGWLLFKRKPAVGDVFWVYLLSYGLLRFVLEMLRGDDRGPQWGGLAPSQWIALGAILVAGCHFLVKVTSKTNARV